MRGNGHDLFEICTGCGSPIEDDSSKRDLARRQGKKDSSARRRSGKPRGKHRGETAPLQRAVRPVGQRPALNREVLSFLAQLELRFWRQDTPRPRNAKTHPNGEGWSRFMHPRECDLIRCGAGSICGLRRLREAWGMTQPDSPRMEVPAPAKAACIRNSLRVFSFTTRSSTSDKPQNLIASVMRC